MLDVFLGLGGSSLAQVLHRLIELGSANSGQVLLGYLPMKRHDEWNAIQGACWGLSMLFV